MANKKNLQKPIILESLHVKINKNSINIRTDAKIKKAILVQ